MQRCLPRPELRERFLRGSGNEKFLNRSSGIDKKERKKEGYPREKEERKWRKTKGAFQDVENLPSSSALRWEKNQTCDDADVLAPVLAKKLRDQAGQG